MVFWEAEVQHKPELVWLLARDLRIPTRGLKMSTEGVYLYWQGLLKKERDLFSWKRVLPDRTSSLKYAL